MFGVQTFIYFILFYFYFHFLNREVSGKSLETPGMETLLSGNIV